MQGLAGQVTKPALAVATQVHALQAIALGGGHHIEATACVKTGVMGQDIATGTRQGVQRHR